MKKSLFLLVSLGVLAACGGAGYSAGGGGNGRLYGGGPPPPANVTTIDVNLAAHGTTNTPYGTSAGYAPAVTNVAAGSFIQFHNSDTITHTATAIPNAKQFPNGDPFSNGALNQSGTRLSSAFSSGALAAGASSQLIYVDTAGVYLFGCFFHYSSAGMRAAIVASGMPPGPPPPGYAVAQ